MVSGIRRAHAIGCLRESHTHDSGSPVCVARSREVRVQPQGQAIALARFESQAMRSNSVVLSGPARPRPLGPKVRHKRTDAPCQLRQEVSLVRAAKFRESMVDPRAHVRTASKQLELREFLRQRRLRTVFEVADKIRTGSFDKSKG